MTRKFSEKDPKIDDGECEEGWYMEYESDNEEKQFRDVFADSVWSPINDAEFKFSREEAIDIGQTLIDRRVGVQQSNEEGTQFSSERYYQLVDDDENKPLNYTYSTDIVPNLEKISVADFNAKLVEVLDDIYEDIVIDNNQTILYDQFGTHDRFEDLFRLIKDLKAVDVGNSSTDERLAFFINVYNLMLVHFNHANGPPQSIWQRRKLFNSTYYQIGEHKYALHSILNGILRGNKKGPSMLWKAFGKQDRRRPFVIKDCEYLVHFAVITGSRTTPPLKLYSCENVREEIHSNMVETLQLNSYLRIDLKKSVVYVAKVFKWFDVDFAENKKEIAKIISGVLSDVECEKKKNLDKLVASDEFTVDYLTFDWNWNGNPKTQREHMNDISRRVSNMSCSSLGRAELREKYVARAASMIHHNNNLIVEKIYD